MVKTTYPVGGATALLLNDAQDGSPVPTATVNVPGTSEVLPEDTVILKNYSENEGLLETLMEAGMIEDTGSRVPTGFVGSPIVRLLREIPDFF